MFSLIQMAMENDLEPYKYLIWLMKAAKDADLSQEDVIQPLLPWNPPAECRTNATSEVTLRGGDFLRW